MTHQLKLKKPLAFFDLETTGVDVMKDRIVEISIVKALPGGETVIKTHRVNPTIPIPAETSLIHGIYDEDVRDAPTFKVIARSLAQFLDGCDLAGYNCNRFDIPLIVEEFLRANVDFDLKNRKLIDVQRIFHLMEPRTLTAAYKFFCGKFLENAHSAEADTLATAEILEAMIERYKGQSVRDERGTEIVIGNDVDTLNKIMINNNVDLMGRMVYNPEGLEVFNFGKHKGRPVTDVLLKEPSFYDWFLKGDFPLDSKRRLTEIKLRMLTQR